MKLNSVLLFALCAVLAACTSAPFSNNGSSDNGKLTTEKAQRALDRFAQQQRGTIKLKGAGIHEIPSENIATAECESHNIHFTRNGQDLVIPDTYPSTDIHPTCTVGFTHFTDGRWVLTRVTIGESDAVQWTPNIDVN